MNQQLKLGADFDGAVYDPAQDRARLSGQLLDVFDCLWIRNEWLTVEEIQRLVHWRQYPEASISAQLRNLRKAKFGGLDVRGRYRKGTRIFEYKLFTKGELCLDKH